MPNIKLPDGKKIPFSEKKYAASIDLTNVLPLLG